MCFEAARAGLLVAVDDRIRILHPPSKNEHAIDTEVAAQLREATQRAEVGAWLRQVRKRQRKKRRPLPGAISLDLGCGPGPRNPFRAEQCWGIDLRPGERGVVRQADLFVEPIPADNGSVNYVTAFDFIEHVPRLLYRDGPVFPFIALMNEIYQVLRWGGLFLSVTPAYPEPAAFQDPTHVNIITEETFPLYFCQPRLLASMYGFRGAFKLESQRWEDGKLVTLLRAAENAEDVTGKRGQGDSRG